PDGLTFYGANFEINDPILFALDTHDSAHPRSFSTWVPPKDQAGWTPHGAVVSKDGTRAYVSTKRMAGDWEEPVNPNGLIIFDVSDIQNRRRDAQFRLVSSIFWDDTHGAAAMTLVRIHDHPYLIFSDSLGTTGFLKPARADACNSGKPGHGYAR